VDGSFFCKSAQTLRFFCLSRIPHTARRSQAWAYRTLELSPPLSVAAKKLGACTHRVRQIILLPFTQRKDTVSHDVTFSQIEVPIVCVDKVIEVQIEVIDFIKMDIEGAELDALHGATASLRAGKIRAIAFEFGCGNVNSRTYLRDFWDLLIPFHFSVFRITPGGALMPIAEYSEELEYFKDVSNYVALRSGA
jgi:hypothetical protein